MSAGIATAMAVTNPDITLFTAEPEGFDDTARSLRSGERVANETEQGSICDAIVTPTPGELTFPILKALAGGDDGDGADGGGGAGSGESGAYAALTRILSPATQWAPTSHANQTSPSEATTTS